MGPVFDVERSPRLPRRTHCPPTPLPPNVQGALDNLGPRTRPRTLSGPESLTRLSPTSPGPYRLASGAGLGDGQEHLSQRDPTSRQTTKVRCRRLTPAHAPQRTCRPSRMRTGKCPSDLPPPSVHSPPSLLSRTPSLLPPSTVLENADRGHSTELR